MTTKGTELQHIPNAQQAPPGPLIKQKLNQDQELSLYLAKKTSFLDWIGIISLMIMTYGITCLLLYIFTEWGANSGKNQEDLYLSCQIFNLCLFAVYVIVCAVLWKIFIGRREQMKADLIQKKLKIQETL